MSNSENAFGTYTDTEPLAQFQSTGLPLVVSRRGETALELAAGWQVNERDGQVTVATVPEGRHVYSFDLRELADPTDAASTAKALIEQSIDAIAEELDLDEEDEECVQFRSQWIGIGVPAEEALAAIGDAVKAWFTRTIHDSPFAALSLELEVSLPKSLAEDHDLREKLAMLEERFEKTMLSAVRATDPKTSMLQKLPSVIALPYSQIDTWRPLEKKFRAALATFEATIRYMTSLVLAPVSGDSAEARLATLHAKVGKKPPSLGWYVATLRSRLQRVEELLPQTTGALKPKAKLGQFVFEELTNLRNRRSGAHGSPMHDSAYVGLYQELRTHLDTLLGTLAKDAQDIPLVVRSGLDFGRDDTFDYDLTLPMGASANLSSKRVLSRHRLEEEHVYLWKASDDLFLDMNPLVIFAFCPKCQFAEGFLLDHFNPTAPEWFSFRSNHRIKTPNPAD